MRERRRRTQEMYLTLSHPGADRPLLRAGPSPQRRMLRKGLPRRDDEGVLRRSRLGLASCRPAWKTRGPSSSTESRLPSNRATSAASMAASSHTASRGPDSLSASTPTIGSSLTFPSTPLRRGENTVEVTPEYVLAERVRRSAKLQDQLEPQRESS